MLFELFQKAVHGNGDKAAIVGDRETVSFSALLTRVNAVAPGLTAHVGRLGVLGIYVNDPIEFVSIYLAAAATATRCVLLDPRLAQEEIRGQVHDCDVTHVIHPEDLRPALATVVGEVAHAWEGRSALRLSRVRPEVSSQTSHYLPGDFVVHCTSGTTGKAKGIVLSDENIAYRVLHWSNTLALSSADVILCTLTLAHCHGIDVLMLPGLLNGCTVSAPDLEKVSPRRVCSLISSHNVTVFSSLPYMYELMTQTVSADRADFRRMRHLISGSAPLSDATALAFEQKFGRAIQQVYGLSEIGVICLNKHPQNTGYVGALIDGVEGRVVDTGEPDSPGGELVVRGKALARGYLNSPESNALMFREGWLWTQDLVRQDAAGFKIVGRKSRFINTGGNKVDPVELEELLKSHPAVVEAVVASRRDSLRTERIVAFVKARDTGDSRELHTYLRDRVASYKLPDEYVFVDTIPRNSIGKVQVAKLLEQAGNS